jgi:hypothetical protein
MAGDLDGPATLKPAAAPADVGRRVQWVPIGVEVMAAG